MEPEKALYIDCRGMDYSARAEENPTTTQEGAKQQMLNNLSTWIDIQRRFSVCTTPAYVIKHATAYRMGSLLNGLMKC
jgi:hypothetical protein